MWQGTRTRRAQGRRIMIGLLAVAGLAAIITIDMGRNGLAWQAGPLHVSIDMQAERGLAISFQRLAPRPAPEFAGEREIRLAQRG